MSQKAPEEIWEELCKKWEATREQTLRASGKAFSGGMLLDDGVAELHTAHKNEDKAFQDMKDFLNTVKT